MLEVVIEVGSYLIFKILFVFLIIRENENIFFYLGIIESLKLLVMNGYICVSSIYANLWRISSSFTDISFVNLISVL